MSVLPVQSFKPLVTISPYSIEALGPLCFNSNNSALNTAVSSPYPAANRAICYPFSVAEPIVVTKLWTFNGGTVSGNIDVGIYASDGTRLVSAGSTAQAGTSTLQEFDVTDTQIGPGVFYMAVALDNTTGTLIRFTTGAVARTQAAGLAQQAAAFALPSSLTLAAVTSDYVPVFGLTTRVVI